MKISILCHSCLPFHSRTLENTPLGGTETGAIHFSKCLRDLGHEVFVFTNYENAMSDNYFHTSQILNIAPSSDVVISVRDFKALAAFPNTKVRMLWTGDSYDQPFNIGMGDKRAAATIDLFLAVSEWHRQTLCDASGFPLEKSWVIKNGIDTSLFQDNSIEKNRKKLMYSSMPYRGFIYTPELYSQLYLKCPGIEYHAFTGFKVVNNLKNEQQINELESTVQKLRTIPGFQYRGNVSQKQLAKEYLTAGILFYPNTFEETSCITAIEAMAAGCVPVTSKLGALPETVDEGGILIEGHPSLATYKEDFVNACHKLITDEKHFNEMSKKAKKQASTYDWSNVAKRFIKEVKNRFNVD
jgi:glycosyltransferase involved in cell wall biosynthesis